MIREKYTHPIVSIVAVNSNGRILLQQRNKKDKLNYYRKWELPQGHIRYNESIQECVRRELLEETGIKTFTFKTTPDYTNYLDEELWGTTSLVVSEKGNLSYLAIVVEIYSDDTPTDTNEGINHTWFSKDEVLSLISDNEIFPLNLLMLKNYVQ